MPLFSRIVLCAASALLFLPASRAGETKILTNQVGYNAAGPKHAVILGGAQDNFASCTLNDARDHSKVLDVPAQHAGPVKKWRDWDFWTIDFDSFSTEGTFYLACTSGDHTVQSYPFLIQRLILERNTLSDAIYFFKEERSSGRMDEADRHLHFDGKKTGTLAWIIHDFTGEKRKDALKGLMNTGFWRTRHSLSEHPRDDILLYTTAVLFLLPTPTYSS